MSVALALVVLFVAASAHAAPSEIDRQMARSLAAEGYEALVAKKYSTAEDRLRRADQLVHAPTIVVDHARSLTGLGRLLEARERYRLVIREGVAASAPASWKQAFVDAQKELADLEPRLSWLVIRVDGPSDPSVTIDGVPIPLTELGRRHAVDPGLRAVRVTASGFVSSDQSVTLREGEERELSLTLERPPSIDLSEPSNEPRPVGHEREHSTLPMWAAFGAGGAGLVVGTVTGAMALGAHADLAKQCPGPDGKCPSASEEEQRRLSGDLSRYHTLGTISGIGFVVGLAGVATGVVLFVKDRSAEANQASITPLIGPGSIGLRGRF